MLWNPAKILFSSLAPRPLLILGHHLDDDDDCAAVVAVVVVVKAFVFFLSFPL
jgi:hypothetical protein